MGMKVLVVYGSESHTAEKNIKRIVEEWKAREGMTWQVADFLDGNQAAGLGFETFASKYDALVVATSSFRQGDAPFNYDNFLGALYRGSVAAEKPLAGLQHAVLGFGDSDFNTYMNCPRLSDMLLEKCGSRRLAQRREINVRAPEDREADMAKWADEVYAALQKEPKASDPPCCDWTVPGDGQTYDKGLEYLEEDTPAPKAKGSNTNMLFLAVVVGAIAVAVVALR